MIKSPIQAVTHKMQYRAIGIVNGIYKPSCREQLNRGTIIDEKGKKIETVILGKTLSLIKKHVNLEKSCFWIVYPKNKNSQNLHLQVLGIWDPQKFNNIENNFLKKDPAELLKEIDLSDNYFSIRGDLVYVNTEKKEFVIKIATSSKSNKLKRNNFKLVIQGEIPYEILNHFVSLDVIREGYSLKLIRYEVIGGNLSK